MSLLRLAPPLVVVALACCGLVHCSASSSTSAYEGAAAPGRDVIPTMPDAGPGNDSGDPTLPPGIVLVHASTKFPAFRVCPATDEPGAIASRSDLPPFPTQPMPRSNLAGVDVGGVALVAPLPELAAAEHVLLLRIDEKTKASDRLAEGSCRVLACDIGSPCLPKGSVVSVSVPLGAFAKPGGVLALEDDGPDRVVLRAYNARLTFQPRPGQLAVQPFNLSGYKGEIFELRSGVPFRPLAAGSVGFVPTDDLLRPMFEAGTLRVSLADLHAASSPRAEIAGFYSSPSLFALVLTGTPQNGLRFSAVPFGGPPRLERAGDGGPTGQAPPNAPEAGGGPEDAGAPVGDADTLDGDGGD